VVTGSGAGERARATGEPVTASSRLAQEAEHGEIAVDEATRRAAYAARRERRFESPMVGRERERRRLHDAFDQATTDRSCQLFTILGAAGVGKSRLVHEFLGDLGTDAFVARGRCLPYGEGITYWPVIEAVRDAASVDASDALDGSMAKIGAVLAGHDEAALVAQRLAELIGLSDEISSADETFAAVRTFLEALARRQPLVVVFDDIHWGEATFFDVVDHVSDWTRDAPILLVCVARPELLDVRPQWGGGKLNATSVLLEPLSESESLQLVDNLVASVELEDTARRRTVELAGGNPLFVEEMLALLLEDGRSERAFEVPPTIQALVAARLDRLAPAERIAIEAASVEGEVFHESSVAVLTSSQPRAALATLARKELIRADRPVFSGERAYRFRHLLIRDAAYESIPKEARAAQHQRHAGWLESRAGDRTLEFEEILGYHLERAFRYRVELGRSDHAAQELGIQAGRRLAFAGRRALARGDTPAAINLCSRAAGLLPADDPLRVHTVPSVRIVQGLGEQLGWAEAVLAEARATEDRGLQAHGRVQQALLRLFTETTVEVDELVADANQAIEVFEELGDELGLARAWRLLQQARYLGRQSAASADAAEHALKHARLAEDMLEEVEIIDWLGVALFMGGTSAPDAELRVESHLDDLRGRGGSERVLLACLAGLKAMQGKLDDARALIDRARPLVDEPAHMSRQYVVPFHWGWTELLIDDPAAAERALRPTLQPLEAIGETSAYSAIVAVLAQAVYRQGRYQEAEELTRVSEEAAHLNDVFAHVTWRPVRAKALARRGELEEAEQLADDAIRFAAESDFLNAHGDALVDLAEVLDIAGRSMEGVSALEAAIGLYEQKGNVVSAANTRAKLGVLRRGADRQASGRA
jgi:tetratricopeptide (TPR) repeat protein